MSHALTPQSRGGHAGRRRLVAVTGPAGTTDRLATGGGRTAVPAQGRVGAPGEEAARLLRLWCDLARRAAVALAHGHANGAALLRMQLSVEEVLRARFPQDARWLDEWAGWEASLLHVADGPASRCLTCRRLELELPEDLPFPSATGAAR